MTNADKIRALPDESLAGIFADFCSVAEHCNECPFYLDCPETENPGAWENWLQQEAKE